MSGLGNLGSAFGRLGPVARIASILGFGVVVFALLMILRPKPEAQDPPRRMPLVVTTPADVRSGNLTIEGNGTVRPKSEISLSPQVAGRVSWASPSASGGRFEKGDVLLRIESADYENAVRAAEAEVAQREVERLTWEEQRELAIEEYGRFRAREGITTPMDSADVGGLVFRDPQLRAAEASLLRAEAGLADAQLALTRTRITAPFDGVVRTKNADVGQYVAPGQLLGTLYDTDEVEIVVPLTDGEAALVTGLWSADARDETSRIPATVRASFGGTDYTWPGYVDRAQAALNAETRTVDVVVRVQEPFEDDGSGRPPLLLGTYATIEIQGRDVEQFTVLPRSALQDGDRVYVVEQDTILSIRPVRLLQEIQGEVFVSGEIQPGEPVVLSPMAIVTDGMTVRRAEGGTE